MTEKRKELAYEASERDPRTAPFGIFTGGSFVLDSCRVFCWFKTINELSDYLYEDMAVVYDFDEEDKKIYQEKVRHVVEKIREQGLSQELREAFNLLVRDDFVVDWWGNFDELVKSETEFAQDIREGFLDESEKNRPIKDDELDDFIEHLKVCAA